MTRIVACVSLLIAIAFVNGCSTGSAIDASIPIGAATRVATSTGSVHGGQQPVTGAAIQLYAVGTTGYGSGATPLLSGTMTTSDGTSTVNSNANAGNANNTLPAGNFTITGNYTCPTPSTLVYLTATGGNPGLTAGTNNSALVLVAPLGQCGSLSSSTFVSLNEITTVATAYSMVPFIGAGGAIGSPSDSASQQALSNAFASVSNMVNTSTGAALTITPGGNFVPQAKIDNLANILVPCVNSTGPASSDCTSLFTDATPIGGTAPTTIFGAIVDIALNPTHNATALFNLSTANAAFQPTGVSAPPGWNLVLGGGGATACGYSGGGNTVTGTVNYAGSKTGRIYLALYNTNGCAVGSPGTSISGPGTYTIRGVPPGTYNLIAIRDIQGYGANNSADPFAFFGPLSANAANVTAPTLTLLDPATVTLTTAPQLGTVGGFNSGAIVQFGAVEDSNGVEAPSSYTLQWSTTSSFTTVAGSKTFPAAGEGSNVWLVNGLTDGSVYYFRAYGTSAGTPVGPLSAVYGPVTIGAPSSGSTVSGSVGFTGSAGGPMYAGVYNQSNGTVSPYLQYIANPVSLQSYSVTVPNSASAVYIPVAIIDRNNNGIIDPGDIDNLASQNSPISVTGATANQNITLPSTNGLSLVTTQHFLNGSTQTYGIYFEAGSVNKLPVAVTLMPSSNPDGANVTGGPLDIGSCAVPPNSCQDGNDGFQFYFSLGATSPTAGDTYVFNVTYNDSTTETVVATVTGVVPVFATNLAPTTGTSHSTTPTFTWTDPVCGACGTYTYSFEIDAGSGGRIWFVPDSGTGLAPGTTSLTWGVDPTTASNTPSVASLTVGTSYSWNVTVQDSNHNNATTTVSYQP